MKNDLCEPTIIFLIDLPKTSLATRYDDVIDNYYMIYIMYTIVKFIHNPRVSNPGVVGSMVEACINIHSCYNLVHHFSSQVFSIDCVYMYLRLVVLCVHVPQDGSIECTCTSGW